MKYLLSFLALNFYTRIDSARTQCGPNHYYLKNLGINFQGVVYTTKTGKFCQKWTEHYPNDIANFSVFDNQTERFESYDHNYCRNPDGREGGPYCYLAEASHNTHVELSKYTKYANVDEIPIAMKKAQLHPRNIMMEDRDGHRNEVVYLPKNEAFELMTENERKQYDLDQEGVNWEYCNRFLKDYGTCYPCPAGQINDGNENCIDDPQASFDSSTSKCAAGYHMKEKDHTLDIKDWRTGVSKGPEPCQYWNQNSPNLVRDQLFPDGNKPNDNFCRNPDNDAQGPWCYLANHNNLYMRSFEPIRNKYVAKRQNFAYCFEDWKNEMCEKNVCFCENGEPAKNNACPEHGIEMCETCYSGYELVNSDTISKCALKTSTACDAEKGQYKLDNFGSNYQGYRDITAEGTNCEYWIDVAADENDLPLFLTTTDTPNPTEPPVYVHIKDAEISNWTSDWQTWNHNFCRNPDNSLEGPWCYVKKQNDDKLEAEPEANKFSYSKDTSTKFGFSGFGSFYLKQSCGPDTKKFGTCYSCPNNEVPGVGGKCPEIGAPMKSANAGDSNGYYYDDDNEEYYN